MKYFLASETAGPDSPVIFPYVVYPVMLVLEVLFGSWADFLHANIRIQIRQDMLSMTRISYASVPGQIEVSLP